VIFHDTLHIEFYHKSLWNEYIFINVRKDNKNVVEYKKLGLQIINLYDFKDFHSIGKWYTESEVMYNIFKNKYLYENEDFIGFSQHDIDTSEITKDKLIEFFKTQNHINFQPYNFETDFNQKILMDEKKPNTLRGKGKNVYFSILEDYNEFYKTQYIIKNLENKELNLCSTFIITKNLFENMMVFTSKIIESRKLDHFDTERKNRIQGGFLERYYGVWLAFANTTNYSLPLVHNFFETTNSKSIIHILIQKLKNLLK